ncbi:MAG: flagellar filament capping protein FliD [Deltaproteobacteria bacterium]|nr:flagellar filament capping protein FliD [Deltaproteobacteria bacterium]
MSSTNLVSGLASGFDWRTIVDQLIAIEHKKVEFIEDEQKAYEKKLGIFQTFNSELLTLKTQAESLSSIDAFNVFQANLNTNSSLYDATDLLGVSVGSTATPGSHTITMNANSSIAQARKISSKSFSEYDSALGLSGEFIINGRGVDIDTTDDLQNIREKINNLNAGTDATGVTASILTASSDNYRLILTSDETGKDAFTMFDASSGATNILSSGLGLTDGTTSVNNFISNGVQSESFSSSAQSVSSILDLETAQTGTNVTIGDISVDIDLSTSLTDIAGVINTEAGVAGSNVSASIVSSTDDDDVTTYTLQIKNTTSFSDANNVLQTLGILSGGHDSIAETHLSDTANSETSTGANPSASIVAGTVWEDINTGSDSNNIANSDTISFTGVNTIGTSISGTYTITDKTSGTVQGLLTAIQDAFSAVDSGSYTVTATIEDGKIKVVDSTTGDSQLALDLTSNNEGGGSLDLGTITSSSEGYTMEAQAGGDASIIVDGTAVTSSTNVIDNVISGVTINLNTIESGSTVSLTVSRNYSAIMASVQNLLDAYNDVLMEINRQFAYDDEAKTAGPLQGDGTLGSVKSELAGIATDSISDISSTMNALSLIGISTQVDYTDHTKDGFLKIDSSDFMDAIQDNFNNFARLFVAEGSTTDGDVEYLSHSNDTVAGSYDVDITTAASQATVTGSTVLTSGIGLTDLETLSIVQGGRVASIVLDGASGENGSSIDNIVNAINSELDTEYTQSLMGSIKNTTDEDQTTAITSSTTWDSVYSNGTIAGLSDDDEITFSGHTDNGTEVNGTYTISYVASDTVQGLLSEIESAFNNEVSAGISSYGHLLITSDLAGYSELDLSITSPVGSSLDFGSITTSNLVSNVKNTTDGTTAILDTTTWDSIQDSTVTTDDIFRYGGYTVDGNAVEGSFTVDLLDSSYDDVGDLLSEIASTFTAAGGSVTASIVDGRIVMTDGTTNSTFGVEIFEPTGKGVDLGSLSGGVTGRYSLDVTASKDGSDQLVLTHGEYGTSQTFTTEISGSNLGLTDNQTYSGVDVAGTINDESATGSGQILTGDAPDTDATTSVEGLAIKYTGTDTGNQGEVTVTMGVAELFSRSLYNMTDPYEGYVAFKLDSLGDRISSYDSRIDDMEALLSKRTDFMINRFVAMELALSKIQNMSNWLTGQLQTASGGWKL